MSSVYARDLRYAGDLGLADPTLTPLAHKLVARLGLRIELGGSAAFERTCSVWTSIGYRRSTLTRQVPQWDLEVRDLPCRPQVNL